MLFDSHATAALQAQLPEGLRTLIARDAAEETSAVRGAGVPRRAFLKVATASGFALGAFPLIGHAQQPQPAASAPGTPAISKVFGAADAAPASKLKPTQQPAAFVQIDPDGSVLVTINRLEFGQGVQTSLPMILAEELDADWSRVKSRNGNADPAYADPVLGLHLTGGSGSIKNSFTQYRELGARTRAMLIAAAAQEWGVDAAKLRTEAGVVLGPNGKRMGYGELAAAAMKQPVPETVTLKDPKDFRIVGQPTGRLDARAKVTGTQNFGIDVHLPGMLTAVVAHPPVFGAKVKSLDDTMAKATKGVQAVLRVPLDRGGEGVAVVAGGYWAAKQGRDALKVEWDTSAVENVDSEKLFAEYKQLTQKAGAIKYDADVSQLGAAPKKISAEFRFPYLAHAPMEPQNCTVHLTGSGADARAELWLGSQMPGIDTLAAAKVLGIEPKNVTMHVQTSGGGFGRRAVPGSDYVVEACGIAKAARSAGLDAPIRMLWSREDDIRGGYYRPLVLHRAEIGLNDAGKVLAWDHMIVSQSIMLGTPFESFTVKDGIDGTTVEGMKEPYDLPMRLSVHQPKHNVPVLWWRSVGSTHTAFVMETLLDEIAQAAGADPVAWRMQQFGAKHPRHAAALQLAVEKSGYGKRELAAGRAWGVAVHESFNTVVAFVVEASVEDNGKKPVLHQATAGVHCNLAINPMSIEAQVQGAALMGLSMCLPGAAITLKDGVVQQSNFGDFQVPRITAMPAIAVHIVPSADAPTGMGEPGLPPLAPAFANAIAKLTGKRLRALPFEMA